MNVNLEQCHQKFIYKQKILSLLSFYVKKTHRTIGSNAVARFRPHILITIEWWLSKIWLIICYVIKTGHRLMSYHLMMLILIKKGGYSNAVAALAVAATAAATAATAFTFDGTDGCVCTELTQ